MLLHSRGCAGSRPGTLSSALCPTQCSVLRRPLACSLSRALHARPMQSALWDESMTLADLRGQLEAALKVEDYSLAARIRDTLQMKEVDGKLAVEECNLQFYEAFRNGSYDSMSKVWGEGDHVQVVHPGSNVIAGREEVLDSWRAILRQIRPRAFKLSVEDVRISAGTDCAFVTCVETVEADDHTGRMAATNVFEKQNGRWSLVLHHASPAPPLKRIFR